MTMSVSAVFNGVLRPLSPLDLNEGQTVQVLIADQEPAAPKNAATILAEHSQFSSRSNGEMYVVFQGYK